MTSPNLAIIGSTGERDYLAVGGWIVAIEGDPCPDVRVRLSVPHTNANWTPERLNWLAKRINDPSYDAKVLRGEIP